jgi:hypothetical protein
MRQFIIGALIIGSLSCYAQNDSKENMILQLVKKAVVSNKMPSEVVNTRDSAEYPHNIVVIHASKVNDLKAVSILSRMKSTTEYGAVKNCLPIMFIGFCL